MKKHEGFTIIEVSMFLAISAALVLLTVGLSGMVARQRFQDTMISLRTLIRDQYEEVRNGINERGDAASYMGGCGQAGVSGSASSAAGESSCLVIGRLIQFSDNSSDVTVSYIAKDSSGNIGIITGSGSGSFQQGTGITSIVPRTFQIKWGGQFDKMYYIGGSTPTAIDIGKENIAVIKNPDSGAINIYVGVTIRTSDKLIVDPSGTSSSLASISGSMNRQVVLLIQDQQSSIPGAAICLDGSSNSSGVRMAIPWGDTGTGTGRLTDNELGGGKTSVCGRAL